MPILGHPNIESKYFNMFECSITLFNSYWSILYNIVFRVSINDPSLEKFDISSTYEHEENPNHLKISLCQERDSSANSINPKIFDAELLHHQNSHPLTVNFLKVTQINNQKGGAI